MTAFNLRSLFVTAILISNCIAWTSSKHQYTHSIHGHRTRHRRQGAGLFLSSSYIIPKPDGEVESEGWGEWGEISPCSRTCGGGVASQKRICLKIGPDETPQCRGGDTKYFSCQTQDCPADAMDFRAQQCAEFNNQDFRGVRYDWVPYTKSRNPCELNCMPRGERFYYRHKPKVIDGTRCRDHSFDVCVNGQCQPVGCNMMLGSSAREDKCRRCRGNGVNCYTNKGTIDTPDLINGYNDILLIPEGATTIVIEEIAPTNNYLALRNKNGTYYLNGAYRISFPRSQVIAGALWTYESSSNGLEAPDKLKCLGPINESLYLSILIQEPNVGVNYEYSLPNDQAPPTDKRYNWVVEKFAPCNATCGGGIQIRNVTCRSTEELDVVDENLCDAGLKPPNSQPCNYKACPAEWITEEWGLCSKRCGDGGTRKREVNCQILISDGLLSTVADEECENLHGPKPPKTEECNTEAPCPTWFVGRWKPCDMLCDEGKQTRDVVCHQKNNSRIQILDDFECEEEKPETEKPCLLAICEGVDWMASQWFGCDTCISKSRTRDIQCVTSVNHKVVNSSFCALHPKPVLEEPCDRKDLPKCIEYEWYATQWGKCSAECGTGVQSRRVFCGKYEDDLVTEVDEENCSGQPKYNDTKPCEVPKEKCPSQWFSGPWTECSEKCGGGTKTSKVVCLRGGQPADDCLNSTQPDALMSCNEQPCNTDEVIPVHANAPAIVDGDEDTPDCAEEDYEEIGIEDETFTTNIMQSDSPISSSFAESESTLFTESGSGFGSSTTDDFSTLEYDDTSSESDYILEGSAETGTTDASDTSSTDESITSETASTLSGETDSTDNTSAENGSPVSIVTDQGSESTTSATRNGDVTSDKTDATESIATGGSTPLVEASTEDSEVGTSESAESDITTKDSSISTEKEESATEISTGDSTEESGSTSSSVQDSSTAISEGSSQLSSDSTESTTVSVESTSEVSESSSQSNSESTEESGSTPSSKQESTTEVSESSSQSTGDSTEESGLTTASVQESTTEVSESSSKSTSESAEESGLTTASEQESTTEVSESTSQSNSESTEESESTTASKQESTTEVSESSTQSTGDSTEESGLTTASVQESTTEVSESSSKSTSESAEESGSTTISVESTTKVGGSSSELTSESTEESGSTTASEQESTTEVSESSSQSTSESTEESGSTAAFVQDSTTASGESSSLSTSESTEESGSTTVSVESTTEVSESSSESTSESTEQSGSTTSSEQESTTELSEISSQSSSGSTEEESGSTTVSQQESTTEVSESSYQSTSESTEESGSTTASEQESTTETSSYSTSESTEETGSTTTDGQESTTESGSSTIMEVSTSSASGLTTESSGVSKVTPIFAPKAPQKPFCKPRRKKNCKYSTYGCCPDGRTPSKGPFEQGCSKARTCMETEFGCCPDRVTPALGDNNEGCPIALCEETLFGCCQSDNRTAAEGNDQEGCPPPPPACASSKYGCCADEETEATGPNAKGCPESETTTEEISTTETDSETSTETDTSTETATEISTQNETDLDGTSTTEISTESTSSSDEESTTTSGGSTIQEGCADSEFGCCHDNETAASGPAGQGCPCNATEFGCCPDGVSPAQGENNAGCQGECRNSPHGCCENNETPAHGPDFEGCCLETAFGCCPDNRKPAQGPHFEGCECQRTEHGCCPDNVTVAAGPNNQGCGCQYTEFGCCPDRHNTASGPKYEGCACHTYQFGCCPDGVTVAQGPQQQGCHCRYSTYGCCGDDQTPALGPDNAGCDCAASKYGCCPDGVSQATGTKFLGCTDIPEDRQAACSLKNDPGSCSNYTVMWYFDTTYGGCSRFWYGGCSGNDNRFNSKEECEDVCVQPPPKDACKLQDVRGPCDGSNIRWYYNSTREQCLPFRYGGCLGNANNFDSVELCQKQCEPDRTTDTCELPIEAGPCAGNFSRWGFNKASRTCEQFTWGGCEGNSNRFKTEAACEMRCNPPGKPKPECSEQQEAGNCTSKEALWSFSQSENRCVPFYYSGCGGNGNKFNSRETCEQYCPSAYVPDKCLLPAEYGDCSDYRTNWYYDTTIKRCRTFYYGGCGGNENNFPSEAECENSCAEQVTTTTTARPQTRPQPQQPQPSESILALCFNGIDQGGRCSVAQEETRYAYDSNLGRCVTFQYLGCGGNQNNFQSDVYCSYYCHPVQDICQLPMMSGPCNDSVMSWFYDSATDACSQFAYGGCEGNDNRFDSRESCESRCKTGPGATTSTSTITTVATTTLDPKILETIPTQCRISPGLEECIFAGVVWFFDPERQTCSPYENKEGGINCRHTATFDSQDICEQTCGTAPGINVCSMQPEQGECNSYILQWFYDSYSRQCSQFVYTGCGGNDNRFDTRQHCESRCIAPAPTTTTTVKPGSIGERCTTPSSLSPCGANITTYYYDSYTRSCVAGEFGNCGYANSYRSEEECERQCGAFRDINVCEARLDPGPCRRPVRKYYFDYVSGTCQPFTYSGCNGGPNRFSSVEECAEICGDVGPAPQCRHEVSTGYSANCTAPSVPRYYYSMRRVDCIRFLYQGCGGNENNFPTYEQCSQYCIMPGPRNCENYNRECASLDCQYGVVRSSTSDGCESCECVDLATHCEPYRQECSALICSYGVTRVQEDGCERCICEEDPCTKANCTAKELCVSTAYVDPATREQKFSAKCVTNPDVNEIPDCSRYQEECASLKCGFNTQRVRTVDGCERCVCIPIEIDCAPFEEECNRLECDMGIMERVIGKDGCVRCKCPCTGVACPDGERCVVAPYRDPFSQEVKHSTECRAVSKPGTCPLGEVSGDDLNCRAECRDDADCLGEGKCCARGCSQLCLAPATPAPTPQTPAPTILTTTHAPDIPAAPQALPAPEPEIVAQEGGKAVLRCLFHGNPPPKISWRRGEITIDGNVGRYRLLSDGTLQIVSLYRNDTGVYLCIADNGLGIATQEVNLIVNDPVETPAGIAGDENAVVTGELNRPLQIRCMAYGYPSPDVHWEFSGRMVPFNDGIYEARGNYLLIRRLSVHTLGQYTCQAYNAVGKPASWVVAVRAYRPEGYLVEHEYLVPRYDVPIYSPTRPPFTTTRLFTPPPTTSTSTTTERQILFTVPVHTHIESSSNSVNVGADLQLACEVDGFPDPNVNWTKDGVVIEPDDRITISGSTISRLSITRLNLGDSGLYGCNADNGYTSHSDYVQINVQQLAVIVVPPKCTDNPYFANCDLIVRSKFCHHRYYSTFCCKSCVEAGQLDARVAEQQADQPLRRK